MSPAHVWLLRSLVLLLGAFAISSATPQEVSPIEVSGVVRHSDGRPAVDALVMLHLERTRTDREGRFELRTNARKWFRHVVASDLHVKLCAGLPGFQPAVLDRFEERLEPWQDVRDLELVLPGPALSISGIIVSGGNWEVELRDGTEARPLVMPIIFAEHLGAERDVFRDVAFSVADDGTFRIGGLLPRAYVIEAWDRTVPVMIRSEPIAAGTNDVVLEVPADEFRPLAGCLVDRDGQPLAGLDLTVRLDVRVSFQGQHNSMYGEEATTDSEGRFRFESPVATSHATLLVEGLPIIPLRRPTRELTGRKDLVVTAERRAALVVEFGADAASDPARVPDALEVLDEGGERLGLDVYDPDHAHVETGSFRMRVRPQRTVSVSERGRTLVLLRDDEVLERRPIELVPGEVVTLRYP